MPISILLARRVVAPVAVALALTAISACGGASTPTAAPPTPSRSGPTAGSPIPPTVAPVPVESNPPGDIPDNLAFVPYANQAGGYSFTHPEGWAQTGRATAVQFTDKLNGVAVDIAAATSAPTPASARSTDVPRLKGSVPAFELRNISTISLPVGKSVLIIFRRNSAPDPVTGKVYRDEVQEYLVFRAGRVVRMDLFAPVGADNVDAYRTISRSLAIR